MTTTSEANDFVQSDDAEFDSLRFVFSSWPYIRLHDHADLGRVVLIGTGVGNNQKGQTVRRYCQVDGTSFSNLLAVRRLRKRSEAGSLFTITIAPVRPMLVKFWTNVDDPAIPKHQRDVESQYRYCAVTASGIRTLTRQEYQNRLRGSQTGSCPLDDVLGATASTASGLDDFDGSALIEASISEALEQLRVLEPRLLDMARQHGKGVLIRNDSGCPEARVRIDGRWETYAAGTWRPATLEDVAGLAAQTDPVGSVVRMLAKYSQV